MLRGPAAGTDMYAPLWVRDEKLLQRLAGLKAKPRARSRERAVAPVQRKANSYKLITNKPAVATDTGDA